MERRLRKQEWRKEKGMRRQIARAVPARHSERSAAESRNPAASLKRKATGSLDSARDDIRFVKALGVYERSHVAFYDQRCSCVRSALWLRDIYLAGKMKDCVIHRHVGFQFIDNDYLFIGRTLASDFN